MSVVVVHYEQPAELARTLHALARQTHPADLLEVVVVDDGSAQPPTVPDGVRLLRRADTGFTAAAARNEGAAATRHPVLVFLDADTTPEPGFVAAVSRLPTHLPEALVVGRRRHADLAGVDPTEPVETAGPAQELEAPAWLERGYVDTDDLARADAGSFRHVISSVLACSRWLFDELGGFDESFDRYGGEDWELAHRAWHHGAVLAHARDAVAWHDGPDRAGREADDDAATVRERATAENLRFAQQVAGPPTGFTGLLSGPPEVVVHLAEDLSPTDLVVTADSLLAGLPTARVVVTDAQRALLGDDPRLVDTAGTAPAAPYALHVSGGLAGPPEAWRGLVAHGRVADHPHTVTVADETGPLAELRVLRAHRRMARWPGRDDLFAALTVTPDEVGLRRWPATASLSAHLGGWA